MRTRLSLAGVVLALAIPAVAAAQVPPPPIDGTDSADPNRRSLTDEVVDSPLEYHQQHGGVDGHLPGSSENVELVGQVDIEGAAEGRVADVAAFGNYAYLTVRDPEGCSDAGVAVIDISDPTNPVQVRFIDATEGAFPGEGAQVVDLRTRSFRGQVLVFNNEICALGGEGGVSLWDVTDPANPQVLTANVGDDDPGGFVSRYNQIHSAFAWQQGDRAFVVIVDNEEFTDVDILEITDPTEPQLLVEMDLAALFDITQEELATRGNFQSVNLHDMVVQKIQGTWTMLLSYWDAGWVLLDVDDPANPTYISDSDYPFPDTLLPNVEFPEGNAHQAEFSPNGRYIIGTDEDFSPYRLEDDVLTVTSGPAAGDYPGGVFGWTVPIQDYPGGEIAGPTIYGGLGCPSNEEYGEQVPIPDASNLVAEEGEEKIVVLLRGVCFFSEKVEQAQLAGYDAVIIANHHIGAADGADPDASLCGSQGHEFTPTIAAVCTGHRAFHLMFGQEPTYTGDPLADDPELGALGPDVRASAEFDGWGYVRLLDRKTMEQIDAYAIDEALDENFAQGFGDLSVHEVAVDPRRQDLAYLSYYSGGLRVIRYGKDGIEEVGHYIDEDGNNFWGVEAHRLSGGRWSGQTLILASDRDSGLWIFRFEGPTVRVAGGGRCGSDHRSGTINLAVADPNNPVDGLVLTATSSNPALLPVGNIDFSGAGGMRTMTATTVAGRKGTAVVTVTVSDGQLSASTTVTVTAGLGGDNTLTGTAGADVILAQGGRDSVFGEGGNDLLCGGLSPDELDGGAGNDTLRGGGGRNTLRGGDGNDRLDGGNLVDTLTGGAGNDRLAGGHSNDVLAGGEGDDIFFGGRGDDTLRGEEGNDRLTGGAGGDFFSGGPGTDTATDFTLSAGDRQDGTIP